MAAKSDLIIKPDDEDIEAYTETLNKTFEPPVYQPFPELDCKIKAGGYRVLIQLKRPRTHSRGGIEILESTRNQEVFDTFIGKVLSVGPCAFRDKQTGQAWEVGKFAKPGDVIIAPKYGGQRLNYGDDVLFIITDDQVLGVINEKDVDAALEDLRDRLAGGKQES